MSGAAGAGPAGGAGPVAATAPFAGMVVALTVELGATVAEGVPVAVLESMKMEHPVTSPAAGEVTEIRVAPGESVDEGAVLVVVRPVAAGPIGGTPAAPADVTAGGAGTSVAGTSVAGPSVAGMAGEAVAGEGTGEPGAIRPDLAEVLDRQARILDPARPEAVDRRHGAGRRTARENVDDLVDPGTYVEYGGLVIAAQRARRTEEELIARTPADGLVAGIGTVNGEVFGDRGACAVLSYDYTVLAGTQGQLNHRKKDRLFELIERMRLPTVLFAEGGGGRPGDTDFRVLTGLDCLAFALFGGLSGTVPLVGIASGFCFAGNAALLGCCDVVIATEGSSIGMGGPAMIEGGGLGVHRPEDVGPVDVQAANGVVDVVVADDAAAVAAARQYLSYFQGPVGEWTCADQEGLRDCVPENRRRVYDVRRVIDLMADTGSVFELRRGFAPAMITALARLEGMPVGVVANDPGHLGGAIDADASDKASRFLQLCEAHGLPVVFLCDTPGFMVGPDSERAGAVRHCSRLFVTGASLTVPFATVILRKGYGLGAQAMAGGSFRSPLFTVAWPTGELGGMGLEGAVRLGFRRELEAIADPAEREAAFEQMVEAAYQHGKALEVATAFEIDDVIDPATTRSRLVETFRAATAREAGPRPGRPFVDTW